LDNLKYKGFYNIVKDATAKEATIFIYGVIGGWDFDKWEPINTADKFVEDFAALEPTVDVIHVKINSPGGNIWDGLPIYNTLRNSTKTINTYVDGIAYSMASLIALAGDHVYGYSNSMLMFHNGSTYAYGNAKQLRDSAETLKSYDEALSSIIEEKLGISAEKVAELYLNFNDNYFVGKKAQKLGFFDEIITSKKADLPENIENMSPQDLMKHYASLNFEDVKQPLQTIENIMNKTYPQIEAVLNKKFEDGEASNGILLSEEEADNVEAQIVQLQAAAVLEAELKNTAIAETAAAELKATEMQQNVDAANAGFDALLAEVNESLELEADAKVTTVADAFTALKAKIEALGAEPGASHTNKPASDTKENLHPYIDFKSGLYTEKL